MRIERATDPTQWNSFFTSRPHASFLQSWEWGEFQTSVGRPAVRLCIVQDDGAIVDQVQYFEHVLGLGLRYAYIPRYGFFHEESESLVLSYIKSQGFVFCRLEPQFRMSDSTIPYVSITQRQPGTTLLIDIRESEERLLALMHPKTRYNIGLAERKGVRVTTEKQAQVFWKLNEETTERDKFKSHDAAYYEKMLEMPLAFQYTAWAGETPIASIICVAYGDTYVYVHGASSNEHRNLMAPYLLQWIAMKQARQAGYAWYDFWGIAPSVVSASQEQQTSFHGYAWSPAHPFTGITRFKVGFGGTPVAYPPAGEYVCRSMVYRAYRMVRSIV